MSTKKRLIEAANKRLLNEHLPAPVHFTEHEVLSMMCELIDYEPSSQEEMPEKLKTIFQDALRKKGRNLDGSSNVPDGAIM